MYIDIQGSSDILPTILYSRKADVDKINHDQLQKLPGQKVKTRLHIYIYTIYYLYVYHIELSMIMHIYYCFAVFFSVDFKITRSWFWLSLRSITIFLPSTIVHR